MKRAISVLLCVALTLLIPASCMAVTYTDPLSGELITVNYNAENGATAIDVYGEVVYEQLPSDEPVRNVVPADHPPAETTLENVLASLDEESAGGGVTTYEFVGSDDRMTQEEYEHFSSLSVEERTQLIIDRFLNDNFEDPSDDSPEGEDAPASAPTDEDTDPLSPAVEQAILDAMEPIADDLEAAIRDGSSSKATSRENVEIDGVKYETKAIIIKITYADGSVVFERYYFIKTDGSWNLSRVSRSVEEESLVFDRPVEDEQKIVFERPETDPASAPETPSDETNDDMLGGMTEAELAEIEKQYIEKAALRNIDWDESADAVAEKENGELKDNSVYVNSGVSIYGLSASSLEYQFDESGAMVKRIYTLEKEYFEPAIYSLYTHYKAPVISDGGSLIVWHDGNINIKLLSTDDSAVIEYEFVK